MTFNKKWPCGVYFFYYHDISILDVVPSHIRTSPSRFEEEIHYIKNHFNVTSFEKGIRLLSEKVKEAYAVICFDDGFSGAFQNGIPVLEKNQLPAIFFLNGAFVRQEAVAEAIHVEHINKSWGPEKINEVFPDFDGRASFRKYIKKGSSLSQFEKLNQLSGEELLAKNIYANHETISQSNNDLFSIGNHTTNHLWLPNLNLEDQRTEVSENFEYLKQFPNYINYLAFPFGSVDSFNDDTLTLVPEFSKNVLIKATGGINHRREGNLLSIERMGLSDDKPPIHQFIWERVKETKLHKLAKRVKNKLASL